MLWTIKTMINIALICVLEQITTWMGCAHTKWNELTNKDPLIFCHSGLFLDKVTNVSYSYFPSTVFYCDWDLFTECVLRVVCLCNHLVLSESMVWNSFSNSSSFRVPSEKKAWNSSRESFPSSAGRREEILAARLIHF